MDFASYAFGPESNFLDLLQALFFDANRFVIFALDVKVSVVWAPMVTELINWNSDFLEIVTFVDRELGFVASTTKWRSATTSTRIFW